MPEVAIVRTEIFTIESVALDGYGNLVVIDKTGKERRVNKKHESLHPVFVAGQAVEVGLGNFMNKEFIHTAKAVAEGLAPPPTVIKPEYDIKEENQPRDSFPQVGVKPVPAPQAVGMMTKEIGDMIRAKMLTVIYGTKIANELAIWYRSQALGITRINYDGKDLPVFK